jgi:hypothetical protein
MGGWGDCAVEASVVEVSAVVEIWVTVPMASAAGWNWDSMITLENYMKYLKDLETAPLCTSIGTSAAVSVVSALVNMLGIERKLLISENCFFNTLEII